jgi:hypothetical protein
VIAGNHKLFCGGFDLSVFAAGDLPATLAMLTGGFNLSVRLLMFPKPVITLRPDLRQRWDLFSSSAATTESGLPGQVVRQRGGNRHEAACRCH